MLRRPSDRTVRSRLSAGLLATGLLAAGLFAGPPLPAASADAAPLESPYRALPERYGDALVTVRFVNKVQMPGVDTETDSEAVCLAIEPRGLVLCSQTLLGGSFEALARLMGSSGAPIRSLPREIEVHPGDGGPPLAAVVVARDSDRDLAWLELRDLSEERTLTTLDFATAAEASVGEPFYLLRRLPRLFGSRPVVAEGVVAAVVDEPRRLIVSGAPLGHVGSPIFDASGRLLGLAVTQVPSSDDHGNSLSSRPLPGQAGDSDDMIGSVYLPADDIVRATDLALEVQAADAAETLE